MGNGVFFLCFFIKCVASSECGIKNWNAAGPCLRSNASVLPEGGAHWRDQGSENLHLSHEQFVNDLEVPLNELGTISNCSRSWFQKT